MIEKNPFTSVGVNTFLKNNKKKLSTNIDEKEKVKFCSSDNFSSLSEQLNESMDLEKSNVFLSQVGGFYVTASVVGNNAYNSEKTNQPKLLFFDRKEGNIKNAIFNTLLMKACDTKEEYIKALFNMKDTDIVKALDSKLYFSFIKEVWNEKNDNKKISRDDLKLEYKENKEEYDKVIEEEYITSELVNELLNDNLDIKKLNKYVSGKKYNAKEHYSNLLKITDGKLSSQAYSLFKSMASNITTYLDKENHYNDLVNFLSQDIITNKANHILTNDSIYDAYRGLISKTGNGRIKFLPGIDISNENGIEELKKALENSGLLTNNNEFAIDYMFVPHIELLKPAYRFIKENVQEYIKLEKVKNKGYFVLNSTAALDLRTYSSIGASFIEEERRNREPLKNLSTYEKVKGFPRTSFMAGLNIGNIYYSENDAKNMIEMAINDNVETMFIRSMIYSTYYHNETARRLLIDPKYETLDSRLKEAKKIIKKLNDNNIKVIYQMGAEELNLYNDLFRIYYREQSSIGNNFLAREDLRSKYDWVKPLIIEQLIPYLIRSGEDITNLVTDEIKETKVSLILHALKLYKEGLPLGKLSKYINPEYLKDTDNFKVIYSSFEKMSKDDDALSINMLYNSTFSPSTQYAKTSAGVLKNLRLYQTNAVKEYNLKKTPQIFLDASQSGMSISYQEDELYMTVPQMINDEYYVTHHELLPGIKERILSDPTHKRVTQSQTRMNCPGGWTITGDEREIMTIVPYYRRTKEVMDYIQKTGKPGVRMSTFYKNDLQIGSPTERLAYTVKALDYAIYEKNVRGIFGNGDFQQGWNYPKFANESRHLGTMAVSQQMVDFVELIRPLLQDAMGVVNDNLFINDSSIDEKHSKDIMNHLKSKNLILSNQGLYKNNSLINKDINYRNVDLELPGIYKPYEKEIREKLVNIKQLWFYHIVEGNHEYNTDWNNKGYRLVEHLNQELNNLKTFTGNNLETKCNEFFVNGKGDIVDAPFGSTVINGYNIVFGHQFKAPGKGSGGSPTYAMANYFDQMGSSSFRVDRAFMGHLHVFETTVANNKLFSITGSSAGQSGYEQMLGYSSRPLYVIDTYLEDGRIVIETIGTEFLRNYKIQNPYIKALGLDKFIDECLTEEASILGSDMPKEVHELKQRKLKPATNINKIYGPHID